MSSAVAPASTAVYMRPRASRAPAPGVLAADVGGTHARVAWVCRDAGGHLRSQGLARYACREYPGLGAILAAHLQALSRAGIVQEPAAAVVAIAGVADGDRWHNANLPWPVSCPDVRAEAGLASLALVNDFVALARGIDQLDPTALHPLVVSEAKSAPRWPALVIGPGTGLGAALRLSADAAPVLASEAGQAALAAGNALELQVLARLLERRTHVANECVLSGPGLVTLYRCLCAIGQVSATCAQPAEVVAAAAAGDALAVQAVQVFCEWLGSLVGDLAVTFHARSVYLAGGVAGHLGRWLDEGGFARRFLNKGVLAPVLRQVPVWRVEHGDLAVLGAAAIGLDRT